MQYLYYSDTRDNETHAIFVDRKKIVARSYSKLTRTKFVNNESCKRYIRREKN